ncbi:unnamed protein product, partial [Effrenium voratum]
MGGGVEAEICCSSCPPSPPGLLRVELTATGEVTTSLRAMQTPPPEPWQAISHPAPWFGSRRSGAKHGAWGAYRHAMAAAREQNAAVALLFRESGGLVDGDRCTPVLRLHGSEDGSWCPP